MHSDAVEQGKNTFDKGIRQHGSRKTRGRGYISVNAKNVNNNTESLASRFRIAHSTSGNVLDCHRELDHTYKSDEIVLRFLDRKFINRPALKQLALAFSSLPHGSFWTICFTSLKRKPII